MQYQAEDKNAGLYSGAVEALHSVAYIAGRRVGLLELPSELNEYLPGTPEHAQWAEGHASAQSTLLAYRPNPCAITAQPDPEHVLE